MNICPICLFVNPKGTERCLRCCKFHFREAGTATLVTENAPNPQSGSKSNASDYAPATRLELSDSTTTKPSGNVMQSQMTRAVQTQPLPIVQVAMEGTGHLTDTTPPPKPTHQVHLEVVRGERLGVTYPVLHGKNYLGRSVNQPVDIDLTGQEPVERVWTSRQHAIIHFDGRALILEDLNSLNGTYVNRLRVYAGQQRLLQPNDIVQIGTVQMRLTVVTRRSKL